VTATGSPSPDGSGAATREPGQAFPGTWGLTYLL
jgi:hypothetical protein